jgi:hypothetical protein
LDRYFTGFNPIIAEFSARFDRNEQDAFDPFQFGFEVGFTVTGPTHTNYEDADV